jgi:2-polyprenyl-6-methoxyphenol hydroxylase-like FAD-dependent oxidoreductase
MRRRKTLYVDSDILVVGGGMGGCGATYEARYWGRDLKIVCVEKADSTLRARLAEQTYAIGSREEQTPEYLGAFHRAEIARWWPIIKAANIKGE